MDKSILFPSKYTVIILNGELPYKKVITSVIINANYIICADGAANNLLQNNIHPDIIIGDFDSINIQALEYYEKLGVELNIISDQDTTDFEKCLQYCIYSDRRKIVILGSSGIRIDHTLNNFSVLKRYYKELEVKFIDSDFTSFYLNGNITLNCKIGEIVSFLSMPLAYNITTSGLLYPLTNENLEFGIREGTLNEAVSPKVEIQFESGDLILFKKHYLNL